MNRLKYFYIFLVFFFSYNIVSGQCTVNIGNDRTICENTEITLIATGNAIYYQWSTNETSSNIIVSPSTNTQYIVTATCDDQSTCVDTLNVFVIPLPTISLGDDLEICLNESVNLSINGIGNYLWSNSSTNNSINVSPQFTTDYWAMFTDVNNCSNFDTITITVNPLPNLTICQNQEICLGNVTTIFVTSEAPHYIWNSGDTTSSFEVSPHINSNYIVTVVDDKGCSNNDTTTVIVNETPIADFSFENPCQMSSLVLTDISTYENNIITEWNWDFKDGNFSNIQNPTHIFTTSGVFDVELIVKNNKNCLDTISHSVNVFPKPQASFEMSRNYSCSYPVDINFNDNSTNTNEWQWDFGNGFYSNSQYPSSTFQQVGEYEIQLITKSIHECIDTSTQTFTIFQKPIADFYVDTTSGCEPINISFYNNSQYYDSAIWYIDENLFYTQNTNYLFYGEGFYPVTLTVFNEHCSELISKSDYIEILNKPIPDFSWDEEINPIPHGLIYFTNNSLDANSYMWYFGDSLESNIFDTCHRYLNYGNFDVTHIAIDTISRCKDTIMQTISVSYFDGLFIPNSFIPNSINDEEKVFIPKGTHIENYKITIYNDLGNIMWESSILSNNNPAEGWDGTYKGMPMPSNIYIWVIDATFENGNKWRGQLQKNGKYSTSGYLTLIR